MQIIDPYWVLQAAGFIDVDEDGLLPDIRCEFPAGSGSFWRLCAVQGTTDTASANLTLTFEDNIVSELRDLWGPRVIKKSATTRAQVIKTLVDEAPDITFVCPSINVIQPIEQTSAAARGQPVTSKTKTGHAHAVAKANKTRNISGPKGLTVKGAKMNQHQVDEANTALGVAWALKAGTIATEAMICAAISYTVPVKISG